MKNGLLCFAAAVAVLCSGGWAAADLLYGMEGAPPPSGFYANGVIGISQSTIGATEGSNSMRVQVDYPWWFVGALTESVPPALSRADAILLDLTVNEGEVTDAAWGDMGVIVWGYYDDTWGVQVQFASYASVIRPAGTYTDVQFDLDYALNGPAPGKSLRQLLADGDLDGLTGFQLYFNQTTAQHTPIVAYIDNIRSLTVPEPATALLLGLGAIALGLVTRRRR